MRDLELYIENRRPFQCMTSILFDRLNVGISERVARCTFDFAALAFCAGMRPLYELTGAGLDWGVLLTLVLFSGPGCMMSITLIEGKRDSSRVFESCDRLV